MTKLLMALLGTILFCMMIVFTRFFVEFLCNLRTKGVAITTIIGIILIYLYFYFLIL